jgi:hypothetical protein
MYIGSQATTSAWPAIYGSSLAIAGSGTNVTTGTTSPFYNALDGGVKAAYAGKAFAGGNIYDWTTTDRVFEFIVKSPNCATNNLQRILQKGSAAPFYYSLFENSSGNTFCRITIDDNNGHAVSINSATFAQYTVNHLLFAIDRSGSGICYSNGVAGSAADVSAVGSLTNSSNFILLNIDSYIRGLETSIYYAAMWDGDGWLDTHLQANLAKERCQRLWGQWPTANGTHLATVL